MHVRCVKSALNITHTHTFQEHDIKTSHFVLTPGTNEDKFSKFYQIEDGFDTGYTGYDKKPPGSSKVTPVDLAIYLEIQDDEIVD